MTKIEFFITKFAYKTEETTDVSFISPMARRKLSQLDKTSLCVLNECFNNDDTKLVFASQFGELDRLKKLVTQYTNENEVSPATFSASVHNAAIGQFSLLNKINKSYNSISAEEHTFSAGLIEAVLSAKNEDILYCYCDSNKITEGFACIITMKPNLLTKKLELEILDTPVEKYTDTENEIQNFLNFLNNNHPEFVSKNGIYKFSRGHQ